MASRQEEKEARRRQREEAEREAERAAARRRRLGMITGGILALAIVVGIVVAITASTGGDEAGAEQAANVEVPSFGVESLEEAARAAGCTVRTHRSEGRDHVRDGTEIRYETNPPTSGPHYEVPAQDGIYEPGNSPEAGAVVHSLEHGRVVFQYAPGTPQRRIDQLESLFNEEVNGVAGYHTLLLENQTDMQAAVAATAWTQSLTCERFTDRTFDALRAFRQKYVDKGPEFVP